MYEFWCHGSVLDQESPEGAALRDVSWPFSDPRGFLRYLYLIFISF